MSIIIKLTHDTPFLYFIYALYNLYSNSEAIQTISFFIYNSIKMPFIKRQVHTCIEIPDARAQARLGGNIQTD